MLAAGTSYSDIQSATGCSRATAARRLPVAGGGCSGARRNAPAATAPGGQAGRFPAPTGIFIAKIPNPRLGRRVFYASHNVSSPGRDDTKLRRDETVFRIGEDIREPALATTDDQTKGRKGQ